MCGISGILGPGAGTHALRAMLDRQGHRGPDDSGTFADDGVALAHNRLSILDLSPRGRQPMASADGRYRIVFNGEVYNYRELRDELGGEWRTGTDTEVVLAAFQRWGEAALDRLLGMFAFALWDAREQRLFAARDRFGVKPFHYAAGADGTFRFASEIKALFAAGLPARPDERTWAGYLAHGRYDRSDATFWEGVSTLPPGHSLTWKAGTLRVRCWYDLVERIGGEDDRPDAAVAAEYRALLEESVRLRFRSDVPVGINLSGGLDSSLLLGLVHAVQGADSDVSAFTFACGDADYDELPWVRAMLDRTNHPLVVCPLRPEEVPALAHSVQAAQDEPFGGLPTLAYARLFECARAAGTTVLLDGQGMDEQWAGYDYYRLATGTRLVQGSRESPVRADCLRPEFAALAAERAAPHPFGDRLRDLQYRDLRLTKIPRALRFNDRVSMRASCELREPFLDHRLVELALRQPRRRKIAGGRGKVFLRALAAELLPDGLREAPKRPVQTPQREWLRGPLQAWVAQSLDCALDAVGGHWLDADATLLAWYDYRDGRGDNSFFVWQWITLGLMAGSLRSEALVS